MNQNEEDVIYFDPIFDFSEFRANSGHLYDCTIDLGDGTTVSAHQAILSTTSEFFFNAFTSGMTEQETRHVKLEVNPGNIFPLVLNWMYNGHIEITPDNIMALSVVTRFYGIGRLLASVERTIEACTQENPQNLIKFIQDCYEMELVEELDRLVPLIAKHFRSLNIQELSDNLDIRTFCKVRDLLDWMSLEEKLHCTNRFLGDYQATDEELLILNDFLKGCPRQLLEYLKSQGLRWVL